MKKNKSQFNPYDDEELLPGLGETGLTPDEEQEIYDEICRKHGIKPKPGLSLLDELTKHFRRQSKNAE